MQIIVSPIILPAQIRQSDSQLSFLTSFSRSIASFPNLGEFFLGVPFGPWSIIRCWFRSSANLADALWFLVHFQFRRPRLASRQAAIANLQLFVVNLVADSIGVIFLSSNR